MTPAGDASDKTDPRSLAASLAPQLVEACSGRLHDMTWFRTDWQRGGAATATAKFRADDGGDLPVVVKFPVVQRELLWTRRLQPSAGGDGSDGVVPRLYASAETLAGYDFAWLVIERIPHGPLGVRWHENHVPRIAEAAARFHAAAAVFPVDRPAKDEPWDDLLRDAIESVRINQVAQTKRWTDAIKKLRARLDKLVAEWMGRDCNGWIHGDLHVANAMSRQALDAGPVTLIDLAEVRPGHWVEDAVYLERLLWASPQRLKDHKPVKAIAEARKSLGLSAGTDFQRLAAIRRVLLAGTAVRFIKSEGSPAYLAACLERLEAMLSELK